MEERERENTALVAVAWLLCESVPNRVERERERDMSIERARGNTVFRMCVCPQAVLSEKERDMQRETEREGARFSFSVP